MELGGFSVSLAVKDLVKSIEFYKALGFSVFHDASENGYVILKSAGCNIGLFQGMFEKNILTFNPGWDENAGAVSPFTDVREIQKSLKEKGIEIENAVDEDSSGPGSFMVTDPDGNLVLFDQHV